MAETNLLGNFEDKLLDWLQSQRLFEGVERVLFAVSGGADSTAMAFALHRLIGDGRLRAESVIGHIHHGLRGAASDADETFVQALGERLGVRVVCRRVDVQGFSAAQRLSIETAGRVLRIGALAETARANECDAVATGHHADDQAETVVHRLLRGTGLRGLCGIRPAATLEGVRFIRPLLTLRRAEIEAYCRCEGLGWRDDASNRSCAFTRNRIRLRLIPEMSKQLPDAVERLVRLADLCRGAQERIETAADAIQPRKTGENSIALERAVFAEQSPWVQAELIGRAVQGLGSGLRDVTSRHYQSLMAEAAAAKPSQTVWPGGITSAVANEQIVFTKPMDHTPPLPNEPTPLEVGKAVTFGSYRISTAFLNRLDAMTEDDLRDRNAMTERLDADCIKGALTLRRPMRGERFWPLGLGREKKTARFLLDAKVDQQRRKNVFVLADAEKILWLAPVRLDDRVKITHTTRRILEIAITPLP